MRQVEVFTGNGVGAPITKENEPERQIRKVLAAARKAFKTNGLWPPEKRHLEQGGVWVFGLKEMHRLNRELERLEKLL